jgi:predicted rRNA methylase YqxC with S4 and FtsJ domains
VVTFEERMKAKKLIEVDSVYMREKKVEKKVPKLAPSSILSRGEKVLYAEAATVKAKRFEETRKLEESITL